MHRYTTYILVIIIILCTITPLFALVEIKNEYLKVIGDPASSGYIIKTTGGDPDNNDDNYKELLYEEYDPTTTFASFYVDNERNLIKFGDDKNGIVVSSINASGDMLVAKYRSHSIDVAQMIEFTKGPLTGVNGDSVKITYIIRNRDDKPHDIGARIMMDLKIGESDNAPIRIPGRDIIHTETRMQGADIPDYWYAFDREEKNSTVKVQGTLCGDWEKPDAVIWSSWDRFRKNWWYFELKPGREFKRASGAPDSAVAIYWNPRTIQPNEQLTVSTVFGLYGEPQLYKDALAITLSGETNTFGTDPVTVTVDIENISPVPVQNLSAEITWANDAGLTMAGGDLKMKTLPNLPAAEQTKTTFTIQPTEGLQGRVEYCITVRGTALQSPQVLQACRPLNVKEIQVVTRPVEVKPEPPKMVTLSVSHKYNLDFNPLKKLYEKHSGKRPKHNAEITALEQIVNSGPKKTKWSKDNEIEFYDYLSEYQTDISTLESELKSLKEQGYQYFNETTVTNVITP